MSAPAGTADDEVIDNQDGKPRVSAPAPAPSESLQKKAPLHLSNRKPNSKMVNGRKVLSEVLPKAGLVYSEKGNLSEVLCKPKILPIKSITLQKIEQMDKDLAKGAAGFQQPPQQ